MPARALAIFGVVMAIALHVVPAAGTQGFSPAFPVQFAQAASPQPGRIERLKERTKESWAQMKKRWSLQRERYAACRKEARQQRLAGRKTRKFLEECMGR